MTRRDDDDELAAAEAELHRKLEAADAQYESCLQKHKAAWSPRGGARAGFYVPLGPKQCAEQRDRAKAEAWAEFDRVQERELRRAQLERIGHGRQNEEGDAVSDEDEDGASTSRRGAKRKKVSIFEANLAAAIYMDDPAEYDARDDGGAYAVHTLYIEDREPGPALLSRPMIGHLLDAIRAGLLPWDGRRKQLRISDEFRTSRSTFVIPRAEPAS